MLLTLILEICGQTVATKVKIHLLQQFAATETMWTGVATSGFGAAGGPESFLVHEGPILLVSVEKERSYLFPIKTARSVPAWA